MHFSQLRTFVSIAREKNLTRAAAALNLSQSAVSTQLKGLEEQFGVALFERGARGMELSAAGGMLLRQAEEILVACSAMQRSAEALSRGATVSVSIGLNTDPTFLRISATNQRLSLLHADLKIAFQSSETAQTVDALRNRILDIGYFYGTFQEPDVLQQVIAQVPVCVAIPKKFLQDGQRISWKTLVALPWIWVNDQFPFYRVLAERMEGGRQFPARIVTATNEQIVRELVASGQGVALMREDEARPLVDEGRVVLWEQGWGTVPLSLCWLREMDSDPRIAAVRDVITYVWADRPLDQDGVVDNSIWI